MPMPKSKESYNEYTRVTLCNGQANNLNQKNLILHDIHRLSHKHVRLIIMPMLGRIKMTLYYVLYTAQQITRLHHVATKVF